MIDAEETWVQNLIDLVTLNMMKKYNKKEVIVINTYQMYLKEGYNRLLEHYVISEKENFYFGVKLVRGAYMEKEKGMAKKKGYLSPICDSKNQTDLNYSLGLKFCLEHLNKLLLVIGTHNQKSIEYIIQEMNKSKISSNHQNIYFSQLYGMGDVLSYNLAKYNYNTTKYLPYGKISDVIPYLIRRFQENSSAKNMTSRELSLINQEIKRRKKLKNEKNNS